MRGAAGGSTASTVEARERELNDKYDPDWADRHG